MVVGMLNCTIEHKLHGLCNARYKGDVLTQYAAGIVKYASGLGDGAGQFSEAERKRHVHDDQRGQSHAQCAPFFQPKVPTEVHARNNIAHP